MQNYTLKDIMDIFHKIMFYHNGKLYAGFYMPSTSTYDLEYLCDWEFDLTLCEQSIKTQEVLLKGFLDNSVNN